MKTPILDSLTIKQEKKRVEEWLGSRNLIEIQRGAPENSELTSRIKSSGFYAVEDWKNLDNTCEFIFFQTMSSGIKIVNAWVEKGGGVWTWIAAEHFGELAGPSISLEWLLKDF